MTKILILFAFTLSTTLLPAQTSKPKQTDSSRPFVLGRIEELRSKELHEVRVLNIYLPEGYSKNDAAKYPVIYLLDGSADEDFIHIAGLVQFNSFDWVGQVPKSIVVGLATVDRKRDFTFPTGIEEDTFRFGFTNGSAVGRRACARQTAPASGLAYT